MSDVKRMWGMARELRVSHTLKLKTLESMVDEMGSGERRKLTD